MVQSIYITLGLVLVLLVFFLLLRKRSDDPAFEKLYREILYSDKYKVKDQYNR